MPQLEVEYQAFLDGQEQLEEETLDPDWQVKNHPAVEVLNRFPANFNLWVNTMQYLRSLQYGGYPFQQNDLTTLEWLALSTIKRYEQQASLSPSPLEGENG